MKYREECPNCGSNNYTINDYGEEFSTYHAEQWWDCTCNMCHKNFTERRLYKLENVEFESED